MLEVILIAALGAGLIVSLVYILNKRQAKSGNITSGSAAPKRRSFPSTGTNEDRPRPE